MVYFNENDLEVLYTVYGRVSLYILGCTSSVYDAERLGNLYTGNNDDKDVVILGTCSLLDIQEKFSQWLVKVLRQLYPKSELYAIGCDVCNNGGAYINNCDNIYTVNEVNSRVEGIYGDNVFEDRYNKIILKIADGCCYKCSYCIINQLRAKPVYSRDYDDLYKELDIKLQKYTNKVDVYLTGTEIGIYRDRQNKYDLVDLIDKISTDFKGRIGKIGVYSIDPGLPIIYKLIDYIGTHRDSCLTHFTISAQYGNDSILESMKRRHRIKNLIAIHERAKENNVTLGWEIIVGYPGETEQTFEDTVKLIYKLKPVRNSLFIYSRRKGTVAYDMIDQVPEDIKKKRFDRLIQINEDMYSYYTPLQLDIMDRYGESYNHYSVQRYTYDNSNLLNLLKNINVYDISEFVNGINSIKRNNIIYIQYIKDKELELFFAIVFIRLKYGNDIWIKVDNIDKDFIDCVYKLSSRNEIDIVGKIIKIKQKEKG